MRIAQVAPLYESVPPKLYGGTERVVSYLTEELVRQGHEVTLFASGDSRTSARLISPCATSLRLDASCNDSLLHHMMLLDEVFERTDEFDLIHFHVDYLHFVMSRWCSVPRVTTLHGRLDIPDLIPLYKRFDAEPLVSISDNQRTPIARANWQGTVYHGLPDDLYRFNAKGGDYLAFVGRISLEKRVDRAIEIAQRCGVPLKIAAKVDKPDQEYYENVVAPLIRQPGIEFVGEIGEAEKQDFLGNARALLFPIDWPEPFGLVMIESLACGTPVIAWRRGSVPEVLEQGGTGFICEDIEEAVEAVQCVDRLNRLDCRGSFEKRFTAARMAEDYVRIYERLVSAPEEAQHSYHGRNHPGPRSVLHSGDVVPSGRTRPSAEAR